MPIPVNKYNNTPAITSITSQHATITIQELFSQIIQLVLSSRLDSQQEQQEKRNYCSMHHESCCLDLQQHENGDMDNSCIIINILQKESDTLLERWMMSFDVISNASNTIQQQEGSDFISSISNFINNESPAKREYINMYTIASLNNNIICHSYNSTSNQERIEFRSDAHLKAKRFHLPNLLLEIVYDENLDSLEKKKLSIISLQSLSSQSPTFISWSKMQQPAQQPQRQPQQQQQQQLQLSLGGNNATEAIHPLATTSFSHHAALATNNPRTIHQHHQSHQQHIPIISVRRLSRLSLSAMQLDEEDEEETETNKSEGQDVTIQDINTSDNNITSIPIPSSSSRMQYTTHHHHGHSHHHGGILRSTIAYSTSPINSVPHFLSSSSLTLSPSKQHTASSYYLSPSFTNTPTTTATFEKRRNSITDQQHISHHSLVGSFEESLLSGRMSSMPSKSIEFICQIGVLGQGDQCKPSLKCPPHWTLLFQATYYQDSLYEQQEGTGTPYVGSIDLNKDDKTGYRIPPKGQLQVVVKNPNKTAVKLFLIPYDFTDMPKNSKTFLRQKSYTLQEEEQQPSNMVGGGRQPRQQQQHKHQVLRYAIHLQFCRNEKKRTYLYKSMKIVFANRKADSREKFNVVIEDPGVPKYLAL